MKHLEDNGEEQHMLDSISFDVVGELTAGHLNDALDGKDNSTSNNDEESESVADIDNGSDEEWEEEEE
jgi:hypothetical protein